MSVAVLAYAQEASSPALESQPVPPAQSNDAPADNGDDSPQDDAKPEPLVPVLEKIESAIRDIVPEKNPADDQRAEDREKADLQAQEDMALWAERMFWATVMGVLTTLAGLILIGKTLSYTKVAAKHTEAMLEEAKAATQTAREATKAARDTIEITRDIGEAQVRAYLSCRAARYEIKKTLIHLTLTIKNSGQSPAQSVMIYTAMSIADDPKNQMGKNSILNLPEGEKVEIVPAGGEIEISIFANFSDFGPEIGKRIYGDCEYFAITHMIDWLDVFKRPHHIEIWLHPPCYSMIFAKDRALVRRKNEFTLNFDKFISHPKSTREHDADDQPKADQAD